MVVGGKFTTRVSVSNLSEGQLSDYASLYSNFWGPTHRGLPQGSSNGHDVEDGDRIAFERTTHSTHQRQRSAPRQSNGNDPSTSNALATLGTGTSGQWPGRVHLRRRQLRQRLRLWTKIPRKYIHLSSHRHSSPRDTIDEPLPTGNGQTLASFQHERLEHRKTRSRYYHVRASTWKDQMDGRSPLP